MQKKYNTNAISLDKEQKKNAIVKIKEYFLENLDMEIGDLQAGLFLDFISENIGNHYYNKGISDSMSFMSEKVNDLYELTKREG